jgi:CO/xanthine dehydrogenase FAD-binding subunit
VKAAPFEYVRADSLPHALAVLNEHGFDAKLIAGGMSLVPMMSMRLARPALLIDIYRLAELRGVRRSGDTMVLGAAVRQFEVEHAPEVLSGVPLVGKALRWVGHDQTRNRGTIGGSLVHADPSAELALAAQVLDARLVLSSVGGERRVDASNFFTGPMSTVTGEQECLTSIEWPVWPGTHTGSAFEEVSIRHGDFAIASAAAQVQLDPTGRCRRVVLGAGGVDGIPRSFLELTSKLEGQVLSPALARELAQTAARCCDPGNDVHGSAEYRRHIAAVLMERVLLQAAADAQQGTQE